MVDISVVIPTHNRALLLAEAVASCSPSLVTRPAVEVVVVDDGSTDDTQRRLQRWAADNPAVRVFRQPAAGAQRARNRGLAEARGEYVKFLDDDDLLDREVLDEQWCRLQESGADLCSAPVAIGDAQGQPREVWRQPDGKALACAVLDRSILPHNLAHLFRRVALPNSPWDLGNVYRHDYALLADWIAASAERRWCQVERPAGIWRWHAGVRESDRDAVTGGRRATTEEAAVLLRTVARLRGRGELTSERARAAAVGLWPLAHFSSHRQPLRFIQLWREIHALDPVFRPPRPSSPLRVIDRLSPPLTELLLAPPRWLRSAAGFIHS